MILSVSRRTDIPAWYSDWFYGRLQAGHAVVRGPVNRSRYTRIDLSPDVVDAIVFWTRDPRPMLPRLEELDRAGYRYCFLVTITPYGPPLEPGLQPLRERISTFVRLGRLLGPQRVVWRYDPIVLGGEWTTRCHQEQFDYLCRVLHPYTRRVILSFVDQYAHIRSPLVQVPTPEQMNELGASLGETAARYGLQAQTCCENVDLSAHGIRRGGCLDRALLEPLCGPLLARPDRGQRSGCGCVESVDIGAYDTCPAGCLYCYANRSPQAVRRGRLEHRADSPLLTGVIPPDTPVHRRELHSLLDLQTTLY